MAEAIKELSESQTYNVLQKAIRSKVPHQINIDGPMWTPDAGLLVRPRTSTTSYWYDLVLLKIDVPRTRWYSY